MASPFRPALPLLTQYAEYHRDRRNIITHFVGVPMIVYAVALLLARPVFDLAGVSLSPAWLVFALMSAWYLTRGELAVATATVAGIGALMLLAHHASAVSSTLGWLGWAVGLFVIGWVIQFVGHYYEGRKPAFTDDLVGLLVGPMFVTLEMLGSVGFFKSLIATIEDQVGPPHVRDLAHQPAAR